MESNKTPVTVEGIIKRIDFGSVKTEKDTFKPVIRVNLSDYQVFFEGNISFLDEKELDKFHKLLTDFFSSAEHIYHDEQPNT